MTRTRPIHHRVHRLQAPNTLALQESRLFMSICTSEAARSLVHLFLAKRSTSKVPGLATNLKPSNLRRFGVVGGGLMGIGIAAALVMAGAEKVIIKEAEEKYLEAAKQRVVSTSTSTLMPCHSAPLPLANALYCVHSPEAFLCSLCHYLTARPQASSRAASSAAPSRSRPTTAS